MKAPEADEISAGLDGLTQLVDPLRRVGALAIQPVDATECIVVETAGYRKSANVHRALNNRREVRGFKVAKRTSGW